MAETELELPGSTRSYDGPGYAGAGQEPVRQTRYNGIQGFAVVNGCRTDWGRRAPLRAPASFAGGSRKSSASGLYCFFRPFFLNATPSQVKQRKDVLLQLPSTYEEIVDSAKTVGAQFFKAIFLGADSGCARPRPLLFAQLPLAEATSLKDLTSRLITRDDHLLLKSGRPPRERGR